MTKILPSRPLAADPWERRLQAAKPVAATTLLSDSPRLTDADRLAQVSKGQRSVAIAARSSRIGKRSAKQHVRSFAGRISPLDVPLVGSSKRPTIRQASARIRWQAPDPDTGAPC